jgi:hypothetical protein
MIQLSRCRHTHTDHCLTRLYASMADVDIRLRREPGLLLCIELFNSVIISCDVIVLLQLLYGTFIFEEIKLFGTRVKL